MDKTRPSLDIHYTPDPHWTSRDTNPLPGNSSPVLLSGYTFPRYLSTPIGKGRPSSRYWPISAGNNRSSAGCSFPIPSIDRSGKGPRRSKYSPIADCISLSIQIFLLRTTTPTRLSSGIKSKISSPGASVRTLHHTERYNQRRNSSRSQQSTMSENAAPSTAAIQSMLKTTTELGDINPLVMSPPRRVLHPLNYPGTNHQPTGEFSASHCLRDFRGQSQWTSTRRPPAPRYSAPYPQGRPLRGPSLTSFQGPVRNTLRTGVYGPPPGYVAATAAAMQQGHMLHPSGTFGNPPVLNRAVRPSSPFYQPTAIRPLNYRAFSPAYSDFGGYARPTRGFLEPTVSSRTTASSPSMSGYGQQSGSHQRDGKMPGSYPESTESVRHPFRVLRRQPSQLSSNRTPSSHSEQNSPLSLPPAAHLGGDMGRKETPTVPLFYDYSEAFGDEDYSSKASTRSLSSFATRESGGDMRGLMPRPQVPAIPLKHSARAAHSLSMDTTRSTTDEYAGYRSSSSDRAAMTIGGAGSRDGESEYDAPGQESSVQLSSLCGSYEPGPPVPAHRTSMGVSSETSLQKTDSYLGSKSSDFANDSGEASPNWVTIKRSSNGEDHDPAVPSSDSSASVPIKIESVEADTTDESSAELVWRRTVLSAEQHAGVLAELNASGLTARNYRRTISPEGGRRVVQESMIDVDRNTARPGLQTRDTTTVVDTHLCTTRQSNSNTDFIEERTAFVQEDQDSPVLLSRASFPWLVGGLGTLDGASQENITARLRQSRSSLLRGSPLANSSLPGPEAPLVPSSPDKMLGSPLSPPQKFKLKMQHAKLAPSTSTVHLRPWNLDENYPWTSTAPDVRVDASFVATEATPEQVKPRKFKLKMFRPSISSRKSLQLGDDSGAGASASKRLSDTVMGFTNEEGRHRRSKQLGRFRLQLASSGDTKDAAINNPEGLLPTTGSSKPTELVPPISNCIHHQFLSLNCPDQPQELRSVFSEDSSDDGVEHRRSSIRHRISSFRARFGSPPVLRSLDGSSSSGEAKRVNGASSGEAKRVNKQSSTSAERPRPSAGTSTSEYPPPSSPSSRAFSAFRMKVRTWKVMDRFRRWVAKRREQVAKMRRRSVVANNAAF